jgi:phenylpyruvate tautomerase PptA (4-oxalocrotonate tautomerase family)
MRAAHQENVLTAMLINDPATVAELRELYPRYEQALVTNDVEILMNMFWSSPYVARFGPNESLYGIDEIEAFRKGRSPANLARTITRLEIVAFGKDFASITVAFEREVEGQVTCGRQSQTWARLAEGWKIVFAHVSILP